MLLGTFEGATPVVSGAAAVIGAMPSSTAAPSTATATIVPAPSSAFVYGSHAPTTPPPAAAVRFASSAATAVPASPASAVTSKDTTRRAPVALVLALLDDAWRRCHSRSMSWADGSAATSA